jgi:hypothetical protein
MCFGMLPKSGVQRINLRIRLEKHRRSPLRALHVSQRGRRATPDGRADRYRRGRGLHHFERHVHGPRGRSSGPKAVVDVGKGARCAPSSNYCAGGSGRSTSITRPPVTRTA